MQTLNSLRLGVTPSVFTRRLGVLDETPVTFSGRRPGIASQASGELKAQFENYADQAARLAVQQRSYLCDNDAPYLAAQTFYAALYGRGVTDLMAALHKLGLPGEAHDLAFDLIFKLYSLGEQAAMRNLGFTHFRWICTNYRCGHRRLDKHLFPLYSQAKRGFPGLGKGCGCVAIPYVSDK